MRIDSVDVPTDDHGQDELYEGQLFDGKVQLQVQVDDLSIRARKEYQVVESNRSRWTVQCAHRNNQNLCMWRVRGHVQANGQWKITKYRGIHTCQIGDLRQKHRNLNSRILGGLLLEMVREDPFVKVKAAKYFISKEYDYDVSYHKAWRGIRAARNAIFGTWESSVQKLPTYMWALQQANPGTVVEWEYELGTNENVRMLRYVFWAFKPCIDGFQHCRPVITVDGTHLYTKYKQKLLIAVVCDGNQNLLPMAYALVDEETTDSWRWFLQLLERHIVRDRNNVCVISDRHSGLLAAIDGIAAFNPPRGVHRFCLRHLASNVRSQFKSIRLKNLCYKAGKRATERGHMREMEQIKLLNDQAYTYLEQIDKAKWVVAYDGGYRHGVLTTNWSEAYNGVLKGTRRLPAKSIVECTLHRTVQYFLDRRDKARSWRESGMWCTMYAWKLYEHNVTVAKKHRVRMYDDVSGSAEVHCGDGVGRYGCHRTVNIMNRTCTCGTWLSDRLPCDHAIAVSSQMDLTMEQFIDPIWRLDVYESLYASRFYALLPEDHCPAPSYDLVHNPARRLQNRRGRPSTSRIENEMDWPQ